jgi:hypothetical protein
LKQNTVNEQIIPNAKVFRKIETMSADKLLTIKEASEWATRHIEKNVTTSNIAYLIQYGRIKKILFL